VLAGVCLFWGTIPFVIRDVALDGIAIAFVRVWVAAAGLAIVALWRRRDADVRLLSRAPGRCLAAGAVLALHWSAMFAAYKRAPADMVIFIVFLAPIAIAALAPAVLGERVAARTVAALGLALGGAALVTRPVGSSGTTGLILAAVAAGSFAALVLITKPLAQIYGGLRLTLMEMTVAGVVLAPVALFGDWGTPAGSWAWLVVLGALHTAVGTAVYLAALARLPATDVGILGYLEPVGVVAFGWLLLGTAPPASTVAGGALIVVAGVAIASTRTPTGASTHVPG
jgi:drug/metabolite transporter (DMT)-like permease